MKAIYNGQVIAESDETIIVESNHYFPPDSIKTEFLTKSDSTSMCHWKGEANYYDITVNGETARNGAWVYEAPSQEATQIKDHLAFWNGVEVTE